MHLLVLQNLEQLEADAIAMHSVSSFKRTVEFIEKMSYEKVFTFLNNDEVGKNYFTRFEEDLNKIETVSLSYLLGKKRLE